MRRKLPDHYLSEGHQRILAQHIAKVSSNGIDLNQTLIRSNPQVKSEPIDLISKVDTATSTNRTTNEDSAQTENIEEMIDILSSGIETLVDETQRLSSESLQQSLSMQTAAQSLAMLKTSSEESNTGLNALGTNMAILQQECSSLKQTVEERQHTSYDGTLIWKITNVQDKMSMPTKFCILM